jgi:hypothetical protein
VLLLPLLLLLLLLKTRAQERGTPLKKPGAYNTDAYYDEIDEGFGDVGVHQVRALPVSDRRTQIIDSSR